MNGLICRFLIAAFCFQAGCESKSDNTASARGNTDADVKQPATVKRAPPKMANANSASSDQTALEAAKAIDALARNKSRKPYSDQDVQDIVARYAHSSNQSIGMAAVEIMEAPGNLDINNAAVFSLVRKSPDDIKDFLLSASPGEVRDAAVDVLGSALILDHPDTLQSIYENLEPGADRNVISMHLTQSTLATQGLGEALKTVESLDFPEEKKPSFMKLTDAVFHSKVDYFTSEPGSKERFEALGHALGIPTGKGVPIRVR
jgi:hypothetical protein